MYHAISIFLVMLLLLPSFSCGKPPDDIPSNSVVPSRMQLEYQQMELIGFIHFTVNSFTDKEWGDGTENPDIFDPAILDANQWARVARNAGMKQLILTAKHHDGFCLWPSAYTEHSVKNSPWKNGNGDIVREFSDACRTHGLKMGLYLSPWDRNHADYGRPAYIDYYRHQLEELLTRYGEVSEVWFDGAMGGSGYYGGANETRTIDRETYYDWDATRALVRKLQPGALMFSDAGPDIRWIGNEHGIAGKTNWSTISTDHIIVGGADQNLLNTGDPSGKEWVVGECDVSIRPGWFYHEAENGRVKSPQELVDIYYQSVGRNGTLLLNIPPDKRGLFHEKDIDNLLEFRDILDETFRVNLAAGKTATASNYRLQHEKFSPINLTDNETATYWATDDGIRDAVIEIDLNGEVLFDRILLQEPIRFGQRISGFTVEANLNGDWREIAAGTTIGYKRLFRIEPVTTSAVRITITEANNIPALSNFGLYKSSVREHGE